MPSPRCVLKRAAFERTPELFIQCGQIKPPKAYSCKWVDITVGEDSLSPLTIGGNLTRKKVLILRLCWGKLCGLGIGKTSVDSVTTVFTALA